MGKKPPPETGKNIKYDLTAMRNEPGKLEKWYQEEQQNHENTQNGKHYKTPYKKDYNNVTHKQTKHIPRPDNLDHNAPNASWGKKEQEQAAHKKRSAMQKRITQLDNKLLKDKKNI